MKLFVGVLILLIGIIEAQWTLIWSDEFNQNSLDTSKWDYEIDCWGGGNNEQQCYTSRPQNVYLSNGALVLRPEYHPYGYTGSYENCTNNNENSCAWTRPCTSGRIRTLKAVDGSWAYGRFEIRAKMPIGDFLWPAIWMLPTDNKFGSWAASGEIDIMEFRGQDQRISEHTLHFGGQWPYNVYEGSGPIDNGFNLTSDFHVYQLEWELNEIRWYIDSVQKRSATLNRSFYPNNGGPNPYTDIRQPFDQRFHMILNVATGGNFFNPGRYGYFDPAYHSRTWLQPFEIDYVRVYRR